MKKIIIFIIVFATAIKPSIAQLSPEAINDLKKRLSLATHDSSRVFFTSEIGNGYRFSNVDSSLLYTDLAINYSRKLNNKISEGYLLSLKGATYLEAGKLPESLQLQFEALKLAEETKYKDLIAAVLNRIGNTYMELADYKKAIEYYVKSKEIFKEIGNVAMYNNELSNIGNIYILLQIPDSALYYQKIAYEMTLKYPGDRAMYIRPEILFRLGNAYRLNGDMQKAMESYKKGIVEAITDNDIRNLTMNNLFLSKLFVEMKLPDSAMKYAYNTIILSKSILFRKGVYDASLLLSELFSKDNKYDSAYKYLTASNIEKDSLIGTKRFRELQNIVLNEQEEQRDAAAKRVAIQNRQKQYALLGGIGIFLIVASILYRNNKHKQKVNKKLESTLINLKSTQSQLVQSAKMASLGELTAGIAHEIQNPLNFVNNFSEVNTELIDEMKTEMDKNNNEEAKVLAEDIQQNLIKILHHGKRADSIVKGMLQHSRSSSAVKEPADINKLADEYLRLAYHGLRAKDKSFNAIMKTDFDESIGNINIVPQDMGRTILNLITNAFYAVGEKKKTENENYEPTVSVTTKRKNDNVEIKVADNGNGIPQNIIDKIFQPFFTTKPTGQGTGLGLSLAYDIVKAHGGDLKVETKEGEGSIFIIQLPHNNA